MKINLVQRVCWLFISLLVIALVIGCRLFIVESLHITTDSMETSLHKGDFVLLDKMFFKKDIERNSLFLFNSPLRKDSVDSPKFISRCIGTPGDTILISPFSFQVNEKSFSYSPNSLNTYVVEPEVRDVFFQSVNKLKIHPRNIRSQKEKITCILTAFEAYQIREDLPADMKRYLRKDSSLLFQFVVPKKDRAYELDSISLLVCREAIRKESNGHIVIKDGKLYQDGKQMDYFFFKQDYYWFLSDNVNNAIDSRHLGIIPEDHILGKIFFRWFSFYEAECFKCINR